MKCHVYSPVFVRPPGYGPNGSLVAEKRKQTLDLLQRRPMGGVGGWERPNKSLAPKACHHPCRVSKRSQSATCCGPSFELRDEVSEVSPAPSRRWRFTPLKRPASFMPGAAPG